MPSSSPKNPRLDEDVEVEQVGDMSTAQAFLKYLGVDGLPKEDQRTIVQAFITGSPWAHNVIANYVLDLRAMGLLD